MKITIVQCCNSVDSNDFLSTLTEKGLCDADILVSKLHTIKPDKIFCSPFLRTLQTIYPYCTKYDKYINVDNALLPISKVDVNDKSTLFINYYREICEHFNYITSIINTEYESSIYSNNIKIDENDIDIKNRIYTFLYSICRSYENTNKIIALVVHADLIPFITRHLKKNSIEIVK